MKRNVPLLITFCVGVVLIIASFIPPTESWGENAMVWFDILAAIAFILGGGNLLKIHLMKIQSQKPGWAFSAVTIVAFLTTLGVGLFKVNVPPATLSEFIGEVSAPLPLEIFPTTTTVSGELPQYGEIPYALHRQVSADPDAGTVTFVGWLGETDLQRLKDAEVSYEWQSVIEALQEEAQPPESLQGRIAYDGFAQSLRFAGIMSDGDRNVAKTLSDDLAWGDAIDALYVTSNQKHSVPLASDAYAGIPETMSDRLEYDESSETLSVTGPLSVADKELLIEQNPQSPEWKHAIVELLNTAHQVKYPWSGSFNEEGSAFWYMYEYSFKPLTATMFSMLAFYVASAAFRAFRAKNFEAILLLGTAFLILLGRTFAGVFLTSWMPDEWFEFTIPGLSITIMNVFNTAGNRAIMIGIALGIVSTSLKVILGIDRSYLGKE